MNQINGWTRVSFLSLLLPLLSAQSECEPEPAVPQIIEPVKTLVGEQSMTYFGGRVASGDLNGDGVEDFLVGEPYSLVDGVDAAGRLYIFYGPIEESETLSSQADAVIEGVYQLDVIGNGNYSISDLNDDGVGDLMMGERGSDEYGRGYIFFGPLNGSYSVWDADVEFVPDRISYLGLKVDGSSDVNGDGALDAIITSDVFFDESSQSLGGGAFIYFGPIGGGDRRVPDDADVIIEGVKHASAVGDVNADGFTDLLAGQPTAAPLAAGAAYLYYGPLEGGTYTTSQANAVLRGEHAGLYCGAFCLPAGDGAGHWVAPAGDVNEDGFDDVYVSALFWPYGNGAGAVYLVHGPIEGELELSRADARFYGDDGANGIFGTQAFSTDINGDGWLDTLIVNLGYRLDGVEVGSVFGWYGPTYGEHSRVNADLWLTGSEALGVIGELALLPDQDGDGLDELFLGNSERHGDNDYPGGAYIVPSMSLR